MELEDALNKKIDLITVNSLEQKTKMPSQEQFRDTVMRERVTVYDAA